MEALEGVLRLGAQLAGCAEAGLGVSGGLVRVALDVDLRCWGGGRRRGRRLEVEGLLWHKRDRAATALAAR